MDILTKNVSELSLSLSKKRKNSESSIEELSESINDLSIKKNKINPFSGGLSNRFYGDNVNVNKNQSKSGTQTEIQSQVFEINEIFKNKQNIDIILKFLTNFKIGSSTNSIKGIIIRGNIGCGKMSLIKACLKNVNYTNVLFDSDYETEDIFDNLLLSIEVKGFAKLYQKGSLKKAVVIRDIDGALRSTQKNDFFKFINGSKNTIPILMTSIDKSIGTSRDVPKCILQLDFENPSTSELIKYFSSEKISKKALEKIIENSRFDIRYIKNIIDSFEYSKTKINIKKVSDFSKDLELDTFECIKFCANKNNNWDSKLIYSSLYTNSTIFHNYPNMVKDIKLCSEIAEMCCLSEELINYSFENQSWDILEETYNILGTIGPLQQITNNGIELDYSKLAYPSSHLTIYKEDMIDFSILEKESVLIMQIISKYFNGNKFIGKSEEFKKEIGIIRYPIQAYKLANIMNDPKKINSFFREFKKRLLD